MTESHFLKKYNWIWYLTDDRNKQFISELSNESYVSLELIKKNPVRSVWKYKQTYIKFNHPGSIIDEIRFLIKPKAKSEFKSLEELVRRGIRAVIPIAWARYKSKSLLLTKELEGFENSRDYWFKKACNDPDKKSKFLLSLAMFVNELSKKNLVHKDFHPGNILFNSNFSDFALVDAYKLSFSAKINRNSLFELLRIIAAFKGEITDKEAVEFLLNTGLLNSYQEAILLWTKILLADLPELKEKWQQVKSSIFRDGKYCSSHMGGRLLIKKNLLKESLATPDELMSSKCFFIDKKAYSEAIQDWEDSFLLDIFRMPSDGLVGVFFPENKIDKVSLFYRKEKEKFNLPIEDIVKRASIFRIPKRLVHKLIST